MGLTSMMKAAVAVVLLVGASPMPVAAQAEAGAAAEATSTSETPSPSSETISASVAVATPEQDEALVPPFDRFALRVGMVGLDLTDDDGDLDDEEAWGPSLMLDWATELWRRTDGNQNEWRLLFALRASVRHTTVATSGELATMLGIGILGDGGWPSFHVFLYGGPALLHDRTNRARGLFLGIDIGVEAILGWRMSSASVLGIQAGAGGLFAYQLGMTVLGPFGIAYEGWW